MNTTSHQTSISEQHMLGGSSRFLQPFPVDPLPAYHAFAMGSTSLQLRVIGHFSPVANEDTFLNRRHLLSERRLPKKNFPVVKATGRPITQVEIDDALDDW